MNREIGPSLRDPCPRQSQGGFLGEWGGGQGAAQILSGRTRKSGQWVTVVSLSLVLAGAGRFEASVIEERRKGAEDLLRFTVHIPALNNSPQLKEFFRVCAPALPWSSAPGKPACPQAVPVTPPAGLSLVQGGEVTRPSEVSGDLHILPPPLIPTPPPDEPRVQPHETWLPQPLPAERRGLEELEVPGTWSRRASQGWRVQSLSVWGVGTTPSSMKSLSRLLYHYPAEELCPGHFPSQGYSLLICKMGTNFKNGIVYARGCCKASVSG